MAVGKHVIAIDDEPANLLLLEDYLDDEPVTLTCFESAREALQWLRDGNPCDAILLDRMMPVMDGMGFMKAMRDEPDLPQVPVIMQTAAASPAQVAEGIAAGVFYYLTKPFERKALTTIMHRALDEEAALRQVTASIGELQGALAGLREARFAVRTLRQVSEVSSLLATLFPDTGSAAMGLREILLNAVEHGNLGITYQEKSELLKNQAWEDEIARRLALPEQAGRHAEVSMTRSETEIRIVITDCGPGFEWRRYLTIDPVRAGDAHGRGIAMAALLGFDELRYNEAGNSVTCVKGLPAAEGKDSAHQEAKPAKVA